MNVVAPIGNLATDVELQELDAERKVASFLLAADGEGPAGGADFVRVCTWNKQADAWAAGCAAAPGRRPADGKRRSAIEVTAHTVEFRSPPSHEAALGTPSHEVALA